MKLSIIIRKFIFKKLKAEKHRKIYMNLKIKQNKVLVLICHEINKKLHKLSKNSKKENNFRKKLNRFLLK